MMKSYVAVLGRQPLISVAELESLFSEVKLLAPSLAMFRSEKVPDIRRLGGTLKIAEPVKLDEVFNSLPEAGKITVGVSDFSRGASAYGAQKEALRIKQKLKRSGRSARAVANKDAVLSSATSLHNRLFTDSQIELLKHGKDWYRVIAVQDINSYALRDQGRPARDAKVGMLPPKLAQILLNLCGDLPEKSRILDPFCGTGVVLQEAVLMGYVPYGTDLSERMVKYTQKNLDWLESQESRQSKVFAKSPASGTLEGKNGAFSGKNVVKNTTVRENVVFGDAVERGVPGGSVAGGSVVKFTTLLEQAEVAQGDAQNYQWKAPIAAVACETYLGPPMSQPPVEIKLRTAKQECKSIILGFLRNLSGQIQTGTPVAIAVPAWLRPDGSYERLNLLDEIEELRYNVRSFKNLRQDDLLYHRDGQVVAREIIVLRKK